jgi:Fe-S-cluster containining protein
VENSDKILEDPDLNPKRIVHLPCNNCDGDCCGPIPLEHRFIKKMWKKYNLDESIGKLKLQKFTRTKIPKHFHYYKESISHCIFKASTETGGCLIYNDRPTICKSYGETDLVRCPYEGLEKQPNDKITRRNLVIANDEKRNQLLSRAFIKFMVKEQSNG